MKPLPYVYRLTHKVTGQFYIGYRESNKVPSSLDLGLEYFTSSEVVKNLGFHNFQIEILAEFISGNGDDAYDFEQQCIKESFDSPNCLNKWFDDNRRIRFKCYGHSKATREKMSKSKTGSKKTEKHLENLSKAITGKIHNEETLSKMRKPRAKEFSEETKERMRKAHTGRPSVRCYRIISPDGVEYSGENLSKFCKEQGLNISSMRKLCQGVYMQYRGWTGKYL